MEKTLQQRGFQLQKCAEEFVRLNDVAFPVAFMGVNDPTPAISGNGAAIAPRPPSSTEPVSDDFPVFHWRHDARFSQWRATERDNN